MTRVLVVDDEPPIRLLCRVCLEAEGFDVIEAADGVSGLARAQKDGPDILLLDTMMPKPRGLEVAQALRDDDRTRGIPIVFLTPRVEFAYCVNELRLGDIAAVSEPFNPLELAPLIRSMTSDVTKTTTPPERLAAVWALSAIAETPNSKSVDDEVESWYQRWIQR